MTTTTATPKLTIKQLVVARAVELAAERQQTARAPAVEAWIAANVTIEDPQAGANTILPFTLWPAQIDALATIKREKQVIILKARQLGMSWLCIAYAVWLCMFKSNQTVMVFSKDQDAAAEMVRRACGIYARLKKKPVALTVDNVGEIVWDNGSRIMAFAATKHAGSSFTATLTILDEFAKMQWARELYTSVTPTVADGGRIIIIATANGEGNLFHDLWVNATKGLNKFATIFIPWSARPGRTPEWYARMESSSVSAAHHRQEYPANAAEAFQSIGEERFLPSMALWDACKENIPALTKNEPLVVALDAAVHNDSFGMVAVSRAAERADAVSVRFVKEWKPVNGSIDFLGSDDNPGPERMLAWLVKNYNVACIVYDPFQLHDMMTRVRRDLNVWVAEFPQGTGTDKRPGRTYADKMLLDLIVSRRIAHDGNSDLRRHIDNANRKPDAEGSRLRIVKRESALKIDLAVCLSMASLECLRLNL